MASWLYRLQMVAITAVMLWDDSRQLEFLHGTKWPTGTLPNVIKASADADIARKVILGLVVLGLVSRNLVRNIQFNAPGGFGAKVGDNQNET